MLEAFSWNSASFCILLCNLVKIALLLPPSYFKWRYNQMLPAINPQEQTHMEPTAETLPLSFLLIKDLWKSGAGEQCSGHWKKYCICATHGVRLLSLLHTLCIPLLLQWEKQQGKAGSDRTAQTLRKQIIQVGENKGALARNQQSWEMLWYLPVLLGRCKGINWVLCCDLVWELRE